MKKAIIPCLICVFFVALAFSVNHTYCSPNEIISFSYNGRIFNYNLNLNIPKTNLFDYDYEINKYNRFGSTEERQQLLSTMLKLGFDKEISLNYLFPDLTQTLNLIEKNIYLAPVDASIKTNTNTHQVFFGTKEQKGLKLERDLLIENIINSYLTNQQLRFNIPTKTLNPNVLLSELMHDKCLRSDFSTNISNSSADRKHNIKNALARLNNTIVAPNQTFSFNAHVGRRTAENGYRQAKIIVNNEYVDGIGGGVCQVSTTLYNSVLLAGLDIVEANKHSKQVGYVNKGFDAMVNYGSSDLKFKNNTNSPIRIITNYSSDKARIRIFGESLAGKHFKLTNEVFNTVEPTESIVFDVNSEYSNKVTFDDEFFYLKTASRGMEIKSFRQEYLNNELVNTELLRHDKFPVQNAIKVYGNKKRTATENTMNLVTVQ